MNPPTKNTRLTVTLKSTPFSHDPPNAGEYYEALGRAMVLWGRFENHFSNCIMLIRTMPEGKAIEEEHPISWKKRAAFWRKAFNTIPALAKWKDHALRLISDAMTVAQDRHIVTHGDWGKFTSADPLTAEVKMWRHKKGHINIQTYGVLIEDLREIATLADDLNTRLIPYMWNLARLQPAMQKAAIARPLEG